MEQGEFMKNTFEKKLMDDKKEKKSGEKRVDAGSSWYVGGSFWVLKSSSSIGMGEMEQGRRRRRVVGWGGIWREMEAGGEGGKAAISVIRRPALARYWQYVTSHYNQ